MKNKSTFILTLTPVFILMGHILNLVIPRIAGVIRPDFSLIFLFLCVMIQPTLKQASVASLLTVMVALLMGGGNPLLNLPALFDRLGSAILCYVLYRGVLNHSKKGFKLKIGLVFSLCTLVSGLIYVSAIYVLGTLLGISELLVVFNMGLPLLIGTILLTAVLNYFIGLLLYELLAKVAQGKVALSSVTK